MTKVTFKLVILLLLSTIGVSAQTASQLKTINTTDKESEIVIHKDLEYHIIDGIWYLKSNEKLILRKAPKGARLKRLPKGGEYIVLGGKKYYRLNGVFYKKIKKDLFEVARP
ncbi:hypothetical protein MWU59_05215 [Flavobacteriaceae bacterium F08102]|nr:hypothetical protein [Flavobacteriaceae bacterium F08102]